MTKLEELRAAAGAAYAAAGAAYDATVAVYDAACAAAWDAADAYHAELKKTQEESTDD